jgi:antitoxin (DNA-binding transcriptional repressor) of toxin-antitoxin stability system
MKTATLSQLRDSFSKIESWLTAGETVSLTKRGKIVAELSLPRPKAKPDFAKRFAISADDYKVRPGKSGVNLVIEERNSYRW